ncbi:MAG: indolepyruvate ferredoxin oxidoreductase family protein [Pseudomonadota bacterium]|nr:indolepyruvate ferredoxin oxidoreductase family protein [Pseudomonadota bacterium]
MALAPVTLDDKYALESGRVFLTGTQALVRLPMMQRRRDEAAGLNTACYISGYRGSPLGLLDQQLWQARDFLEKHHIKFLPGVNEDLAATAILGTQQLNMSVGARYDDVFSMWYAKGPGVDRSGDILRHGNLFGTSPNGGVLLLAGDDHTCKSSTTAHQTEYAFMDAMIPVLNPAGVQEFLDLGLYGWAMSRFSGCWTAFKLIAETVDSSASVYVDPYRVDIKIPDDFDMPEGGLGIRYPDTPLEMEERLHRYKIYAALAFARANKIDKAAIDGPNRRLGIVTCGKSYLDVRQALEELGINEDYARAIGLSIYKVGMTWPLEPEGIRQFCEGLEEVLVVEEKRAVIERQLKEQLYNWDADRRPRVIGKFDEEGEWILPSIGELTPTQIARVIAKRLGLFHTSSSIDDRIKFLEAHERSLQSNSQNFIRTPYFCSGCPHNSSTKVPDGSRALSGIGCHFMAQWMERNTATFTHMGAEGVPWVGIAPFTDEKHVFANIGDGTYYHSGLMAIRQAIAAKVDITYKILFNDAVAMTGGQPHDGPLTVPRITQQMVAEGASRVVVVTDEPDKYPREAGFAKGTRIYHRDELMKVQKEIREEKGVTILVYDQTCAAEKRRRRRRGTFPDPMKRVMINDLVCEGCGDCSVKSNCLSVVPKETEFGRKRTIDQSSCNKDYSCVKGFCPSFVTVHGTDLKKPKTLDHEMPVPDIFEALPMPTIPETTKPYGMLVTGIGGTGVVTIGAIVAMAAHIEGKGCSVLDMVGLAQKGGAVVTHIRIADRPDDLHAVRIAAGGADMILGCDIVTAASMDVLSKVAPGATTAVINSHETITGEFTRDPDLDFPHEELHQGIAKVVGSDRVKFLEGTKLATALLGNSIASNMFMLGCSWQQGLVPISQSSLFQAIELNNVAIDANKKAFLWGRRAAHDLDLVRKMASTDGSDDEVDAGRQVETLVSLVEQRVKFLREYQGERLARRYKDFVVKVQTSEAHRVQGAEAISMAVAKYYFKLLAYKDEYEVARLHSESEFLSEVADTFEAGYKLKFHLSPPLLSRRDPDTGEARKMEFGGWVLPVFRLVAKLKFLRGTPFDIFGYTDERRRERRLISEYEGTVNRLLRDLTVENYAVAVEIVSLPEQIRGYGHVKARSIDAAKLREGDLLLAFANPVTLAAAAAE